MMDRYDETEEETKDTYKDSHRFRIGKLIGRIFKFLAIAMIIAVYGIIFIRLYFSKVPSDFKNFTWTQTVTDWYESTPDRFDALMQDSVEGQDDNGYFQISDIAFVRDAGEVQFTIRYNSRNTINVLMEKYGLAERPTGESFIYILRDDSGNVYTRYTFASKARPMNEFRRIVFDGVDFTEAKALYVDIYYGGDVSDTAPMNVTFTVYNVSRTLFPLEVGKPSSPNFALTENPAYINNLDD